MNTHLAQPHVLEQHRIPLETAINGSLAGKSELVSRLYALALETALAKKNVDTPGVLKHRQCSGKIGDIWAVTATTTDEASGIFVTLRGQVHQKDEPRSWSDGPFLILGKKFVQELKPPQLHNTAVKIWR